MIVKVTHIIMICAYLPCLELPVRINILNGDRYCMAFRYVVYSLEGVPIRHVVLLVFYVIIAS